MNQTTLCEWCNSPKHENSLYKYHGLEWYFRYFSNYDQILRLVAWIHRFIHNCKLTKISRLKEELSLEEINAAQKVTVKFIQEKSFTSENNNKLGTFDVYKDKHIVLTSKTKIVYRKDTKDFRWPVILTSDHTVVRRLIMIEHIENILMQDVKQISLMNTKNFDVADENKLNRKLKYRPKLELIYEQDFDLNIWDY